MKKVILSGVKNYIHNNHIRHLVLAKSGLKDCHIKKLEKLLNRESLDYVDLSGNDLTKRSISRIKKCVKNKENLYI